MKPGRINDKILYLRLSEKDRDAFVETYDLYFDQIYRFVFFKVSDKEEAEDLTSAVFLKVWGYVQDKSIKDYKTLKALLYKVAKNVVIDHYRKKSAQSEHFSLDAPGNSFDIKDERQDPHKEIEHKHSYSQLEEKLFELKDEYREVIVMRYVNEMSIGEIAAALEKSSGNIRVTLYRALKALRTIVGEE
jgi:RNA polymerase sigma-70 factor (ECF subfamily)